MPKLTICVPTRNGARWFGETLGAILALDYTDFEVIVGDDASTDGTPDIAARTGDPRVQVHRFDECVGLGANWNRTLELARGDYVALVCQDDLVSPEWASRLIQLLEKHRDADLAFCRRSFRFEDAISRETLGSFFEHRYPEILRPFYESISEVIPPDLMVAESFKHLFEINLIGEPSFAILRRSARAVQQGFNPSLEQMIDWEFFTRFFDRPVLHCPEILGVFRLHAAGTSLTNSRRRHDQEYGFLLGVIPDRFRRHLTAEQCARLEARRTEVRRLVAHSIATDSTAETPPPAASLWQTIRHGGDKRGAADVTRAVPQDVSARPVILVGMHRSGTSLAAALLESAGVSMGDRLMQGNWSNPRGHFEDMDFLEFQLETLAQLGLSKHGWVASDLPELPAGIVDRARRLVESKTRNGRLWGWKDPRTVLFLPLWSSLIPDARFALLYRAPWEVIDSLYRRGDAVFADNPELAIAMWLQYNRRLLDLARSASARCVLANVTTVTLDPPAWVAAVAECLGSPLQEPRKSIYEADLLHGDQARGRASLLFRHFPEVLELFAALERRAFRPAGMIAPEPRAHGWTAEEERRLAMGDWQRFCAVSAERDHMRQEMQELMTAVATASQAITDAKQAASKTAARLQGLPGESVRWSK